jgi:hypothetical protein
MRDLLVAVMIALDLMTFSLLYVMHSVYHLEKVVRLFINYATVLMANNSFGDEIIDCRLLGPLLRVCLLL